MPPSIPFPPLPDELDDAVYEAYLAFVASNLRGWRPRPESPPTPGLTTAPSTPDRTPLTPLTPDRYSANYASPSNPRSRPPPSPSPPVRVPPRSSSLPLVRASPNALKRISAPMPLRPKDMSARHSPSVPRYEQSHAPIPRSPAYAVGLSSAGMGGPSAKTYPVPQRNPVPTVFDDVLAPCAGLPCIKEVRERPVERVWW
ncbi:hypothetical protein CC85DRAFT_329146 [Cutaneotrichosporon oleaginosum]|uniref:Uncharacterized protein n=1 Tax=Cutaneotrichosporon oleaginosum TaxID=879819 RepID=A0A0J0XJJ0_9TREE|nr:uncharacterized protein CC85DRAFT_329146 [Cutaneotrichosporon oleaginosum]KLT41267.1 hypothetical protein CC85DRAFT_329146 [Cutaneotrichosporon oleaginosum]